VGPLSFSPPADAPERKERGPRRPRGAKPFPFWRRLRFLVGPRAAKYSLPLKIGAT